MNSTRRLVIVITALLTGATVAFTGTIGFIGLVVPHIVRLLCGPGPPHPAAGLRRAREGC